MGSGGRVMGYSQYAASPTSGNQPTLQEATEGAGKRRGFSVDSRSPTGDLIIPTRCSIAAHRSMSWGRPRSLPWSPSTRERARLRRVFFSILPTAVRGIPSTKKTWRGCL